jgi:uncharacterized protein (TIGR02271 family)
MDNSNRSGRSAKDLMKDAVQSAKNMVGGSDESVRREASVRGVEGEQRLTLSEEELAVGKRQVQKGETVVGKTVETEHVAQSVPVTSERVVVERRPVEGGMRAATAGDIREESIRVPVREEEIVAEKRAVAKEEVVIRKEVETRDANVEADLQRERLEVKENVTRTGNADPRDPNSGMR